MQLRDYQAEAVGSIWKYFQDGNKGNPVVAMPTGTGKSLVIAGFVESVFKAFPTQKILALTHVKELIEQNHAKLESYWPGAPAGIYSSGLKRRDVYNNIIFGGIASVNGKAELFGHVDLVLIDEAHLLAPNDNTMYRKFIAKLMERNPNLKIIGLTATPYRLGQGLITDGGMFTDICFDITGMEAFNRLIAEGYLAPLIPKRTQLALDTDGVHIRGGEFIQKELQKAVDKNDITEGAIKEALEHGHDRNSWIVFTAGVEHTMHVTEMLNYYGVPAVPVHGGNKQYKMPAKERDENIRKFKAGEVRAIVNNNVLTTGFDHPPVDLILSLRPTQSPGLWVQMLGRGTRPVYAPGFDLSTSEGRLAAIEAGGKQNCLVLDFAGNTRKLGPINDPVLPRKKGKGGGEAPVKECEQCQVINHASVRFCINCGTEFVFKGTKLNHTAGTDEIIKGDLPQMEEFPVNHITYDLHHKAGKPPSMVVTYYCGYRQFREFVCFEHEGFAARKAKLWWRDHCGQPGVAPPPTAADALGLTSTLKTVKKLRVWVNKKYPEIMAHFYAEEDEEAGI